MIAPVSERIPLTVAMLAFNSAKTLPRALESVSDVAEVIVADGGSQDGTREIVLAYGRTLVEQPAWSQSADGRLADYGAARDHVRKFATQPWIMQLDSDEYASAGLIEDLRTICSLDVGPSLYTVAARYEVNGEIIDCATTYPMRFPRVYRAASCTGYVGLTHERAVVEGTSGALESWFVIPYPPVRLMLRKWLRYLELERMECVGMPAEVLHARVAFHRSAVRWFLRDFRAKRASGCSSALPAHLEWLRFCFYMARYLVTRRVAGRRGRGGGRLARSEDA